MTVWTSAILVAVWALGAAAWSGEPMAMLFLGVWVGGGGLSGCAGRARQAAARCAARRADAAARFRTIAGTTGSTPPPIEAARNVTHAHPYRGPLFMVAGRGAYAVNDTLMKLATVGLPPYETLMLRGIAAVGWGLPLLLALGYGRQLPLMFERRVLTRNLCELGAILCYVMALANMPIADAAALGQITPLHRHPRRVVRARRADRRGCGMALIGLGFVGALMVAQPSGRRDLGLRAAGARQRRALGGARHRRQADRAAGAGDGGGAVGGGGGADRRRRLAPGLRAVGLRRTAAQLWLLLPGPGSS